MVTIDEIFEIREYDFCGHVFDLQIEPEHWYFANGIIAHNCMCSLVPRVSKVEESGSESYASFINKLSDKQLDQLLPKWAGYLVKQHNVSIAELLRSDGLGLITKEEFRQRVGAVKFNELGL